MRRRWSGCRRRYAQAIRHARIVQPGKITGGEDAVRVQPAQARMRDERIDRKRGKLRRNFQAHRRQRPISGEQLDLLPEKAIWWPRRRTLLVADVHCGKDATFRAMGVPVPVREGEWGASGLSRRGRRLHFRVVMNVLERPPSTVCGGR